MKLLGNNRLLALLALVIFAIGGYLLYQSQQTPELKVNGADVQTLQISQESPKFREGDTSQDGHWHADGTFHAQPHETETPAVPVETGTPLRSPGAEVRRVPSSQRPVSDSSLPPAVKLDPETQARVDALYKQADALSKEASVWSNRLYAESQEHLKEIAENKAEIAKAREMLSDPSLDKATYKAFQDALDVRVRATNAEAIRLNDLYIQNWDRREEAMRLRTEARRLQGLE